MLRGEAIWGSPANPHVREVPKGEVMAARQEKVGSGRRAGVFEECTPEGRKRLPVLGEERATRSA